MKNSNFLFIVTAHQNNEAKVECLKNNLIKLREDGIDTCVATHTSFGLDVLGQYCNYIVFDQNNEFPKIQDVMDNLGDIPDEKLNNIFHQYYVPTDGIVLKSRFWESHSKPAQANFKNGIEAAKNFGYEWIVYIEYDANLPNINIKEYFDNKIEELESKDLEGHGYLTQDGSRNGMLWPHFFLMKTSIFTENESFMDSWQTSLPKFFKGFGTECFEEVITNLVVGHKIQLEDHDMMFKNMRYEEGVEIKDISNFGFLMATEVNKKNENDFFGKRNPTYFYTPRFYSHKVDESNYGLAAWILSYEQIPVKNFVKLKVYENEVPVWESPEFEDIIKGRWFSFNLYSGLNESIEKMLKLEMIVRLEDNSEFSYSYGFNSKDIRKYHILFNQT